MSALQFSRGAMPIRNSVAASGVNRRLLDAASSIREEASCLSRLMSEIAESCSVSAA